VASAMKRTQRLRKTKGLMVNLLKANIMAFTQKYESEPMEPLKLGEMKLLLLAR
jgi:hypothetical protein